MAPSLLPPLRPAACEAPNAIEIYECIINGLKLEAEAEVGGSSRTVCRCTLGAGWQEQSRRRLASMVVTLPCAHVLD